MITKIVFVVMFIALARLGVDTYRRGSLGFRKIDYGCEIAVVGSVVALILFGPLDALGVLTVFCYELFLKAKEYKNDRV
jgi:hypothetical protein